LADIDLPYECPLAQAASSDRPGAGLAALAGHRRAEDHSRQQQDRRILHGRKHDGNWLPTKEVPARIAAKPRLKAKSGAGFDYKATNSLNAFS
jgi:hypothetical protein